MLDQMIRDYTANITEAEQAVAQTIGNLRLWRPTATRTSRRRGTGAARPWPPAAAGDQLRAAGNTAEADRLDHLAKVALERQIKAEQDGQGLPAADHLPAGGRGQAPHRPGGHEGQAHELKSRRDELVSRQKWPWRRTRCTTR